MWVSRDVPIYCKIEVTMMKLLHLVISILNILVLAFIGGPWLLEEFRDLIYVLGGPKDLPIAVSFEFYLLDFSIPLLFVFLIFYNFQLIKSQAKAWSRIGLVVSEIAAIVGLVLGIYLWWGSFYIVGGWNQVVTTLYIIPLVIQLVTTLKVENFSDKQFDSTKLQKPV